MSDIDTNLNETTAIISKIRGVDDESAPLIKFSASRLEANCKGSGLSLSESMQFEDTPGSVNHFISGLTDISVEDKEKDSYAVNKKYVDGIALQSQKAVSYNTITDMINALNGQADKTKYIIGRSIYIVDTRVPDFWISEIGDEQVTYEGTEVQFLSELENEGKVQLGYFFVSRLETGKIDLSGFLEKQNPTAVGVLALKTDDSSTAETPITINPFAPMIEMVDFNNGHGVSLSTHSGLFIREDENGGKTARIFLSRKGAGNTYSSPSYICTSNRLVISTNIGDKFDVKDNDYNFHFSNSNGYSYFWPPLYTPNGGLRQTNLGSSTRRWNRVYLNTPNESEMNCAATVEFVKTYVASHGGGSIENYGGDIEEVTD